MSSSCAQYQQQYHRDSCDSRHLTIARVQARRRHLRHKLDVRLTDLEGREGKLAAGHVRHDARPPASLHAPPVAAQITAKVALKSSTHAPLFPFLPHLGVALQQRADVHVRGGAAALRALKAVLLQLLDSKPLLVSILQRCNDSKRCRARHGGPRPQHTAQTQTMVQCFAHCHQSILLALNRGWQRSGHNCFDQTVRALRCARLLRHSRGHGRACAACCVVLFVVRTVW